MTNKLIAKVTSEGKLEIPLEILQQLQPNSEYEISIKEKTIILEKKVDLSINLDQFLAELDQLEPDPNQPSLEEISTIVKQVREELWGK